MPRPSPNILLESKPSPSYKFEQVIQSDGVWSVHYKDSPINLRTASTMAFSTPRYKPTSFANKGHAINLAKKLNKQFDTTEFTVVISNDTKTIYSE
jgi:hypothetical protein